MRAARIHSMSFDLQPTRKIMRTIVSIYWCMRIASCWFSYFLIQFSSGGGYHPAEFHPASCRMLPIHTSLQWISRGRPDGSHHHHHRHPYGTQHRMHTDNNNLSGKHYLSQIKSYRNCLHTFTTYICHSTVIVLIYCT